MDRLTDTFRRAIEEELQPRLAAVLDPLTLMDIIGSLGIDLSAIGRQGTLPGFDPYRVLGLERTASDADVKERYRDLVKLLHPDTAPAPGTDCLFGMVNAAYELIRKERGWQPKHP